MATATPPEPDSAETAAMPAEPVFTSAVLMEPTFDSAVHLEPGPRGAAAPYKPPESASQLHPACFQSSLFALTSQHISAFAEDQRLHGKLENLEQVLKHMREVAERRQQLEFEHDQALAVLTFKQDEVKRLQRAQFAAKKEQEGVVQMLETTLDSMQVMANNIIISSHIQKWTDLLAHSVLHLEEPNTHVLLLPDAERRGPPQVFISRYSYNPYDGTNDNPDLELPLTAGAHVGELADAHRGRVPSTFVDPVVQPTMSSMHPPAVSPLFSNYSQDPWCLRMDSPVKTNMSAPSADILDVAFENDIVEASADTVPYPRRLTVIKQLTKSIIISWDPPLVPAGWGDILSYNIYVDKELRLNVSFGSQTKAVLERLDVQLKTYRISVQSVTDKGTSDQLRCTFLVGRDVCVAPTQLKVENITSTSANLMWLPSNSNYVHAVYLNGAYWHLVKAGTYSLCLVNLRPNQSYSVKVECHSPQTHYELPPHQREHRNASTTFTTLMAGPPEPPSNVRLQIGPSPGIALVKWLPVLVDAAGTSNNVHVTGYTIYADKQKVMEVSSPTTSSVLLGQSQIHLLESAYELTVRTMSPLGESADSVPAQVLPELLSAIRHGVSLDPNLEMPVRNVSTLLRNPPLGAPANSLDQASMIHGESGIMPEGSAKPLPPTIGEPLKSSKNQGSQRLNHLSETSDQIMHITQANTSCSTQLSAEHISLKSSKREHQSGKMQMPPLPDIQEEEEPYSDNPESGGASCKPDHYETDSDEEHLRRLMRLPWQAQNKKHLVSISEGTEEEDNIEKCVEPPRPSSAQNQQVGPQQEKIIASKNMASPPDRHSNNNSGPVGGDRLPRISKPQGSEVSYVTSKPRHYIDGDQGERLSGRCGRILHAKSKPERRVHYSDIVESISYQEEDSDNNVNATITEIFKAPERVHQSYHVESSHKGGDQLRNAVLQKNLMSPIRHSSDQYLGSKTVIRTRASEGSGMEINLEYGTEDDDESVLGGPADVFVEKMSSEWWLEGGQSKLLQGFVSCSDQLNKFTTDTYRAKKPQLLSDKVFEHKVARIPQHHHRRVRMGASKTEGSYVDKHHNMTEDESYQQCAKFEQAMKGQSIIDNYQRDTCSNEGKSWATVSCTQERRRQSLMRVRTKTRRLKDGARLAAPEAGRDLDGLFEDNPTRIFVALFPYEPAVMSPNPDTADEELPFMEGQIIQVYGDKDADGFYYGESNGHFGYIPCNMVSEVKVGDEESRQQLLQCGFLPAEVPMEKSDSRHSAMKLKDQTPCRMVAIFDYDPRQSSPNIDIEAELTFKAGDTVLVFGNLDSDGFFYGELNGQRGLVPSNFLRAVSETEVEECWGAGKGCRRTVHYKH
nr:RIMS-binding protein 2-like [Paramormyrops kingsleyae]